MPLVGGIDSIAAARGPSLFAVPERRPDIAVNLHGRGPQSTAALMNLDPHRLISFRIDDNAAGDGPVWMEDCPRHERERWCQLLNEFGIATDPTDVALAKPSLDPVVENAVVIHPGAAYASRRWPPERFAAVAREFAKAGHPVVVTGSAREAAVADAIVVNGGLSTGAVVAGKLDVLELASLIAHAKLVVCGDTGPAHLASAYSTPSVVLFGPTPPHRWGPPDRPWHVSLWRAVDRTRPANPRGRTIDPALAAITVADVVTAARSVIDL